MNDDLIRRWNTVVGPDDEVIIVGDLAMGRLEESLAYVSLLNGHKRLVPGNHDRMFGCHGTKYANMVQRYLDAGIDEVLDEQIEITINGDPFLVCHFPYKGDSKEGHEDRYQEKRPKDQGMFLIHGHTHGLWRKSGRMIDVGVDAWGGRPVSEHELDYCFHANHESYGPYPW